MTLLHWSAPRLASGDFTAEDPLAVNYIGQQVGNWLWPGFTSRTGRVGYYLMVCYGLKKVDTLLAQHGLARTDENRRAWFQRFERLWALAICAHHHGQIPSAQSIRGIQGVTRAWTERRGGAQSLAYTLISRQLELAGLGAYLSSLRAHGLVADKMLRPTPIGAALAGRMWSDDGRLDPELESFVDRALEPGRDEVPERVGRQTLASLGRRCTLATVRQRTGLRTELDRLLFGPENRSRPLAVLPEMAVALAAAWGDGVRDLPGFLMGLEAGRWGERSPAVLENARVAIAVARTATVLRVAFDRVYRRLIEPYELTLEAARDALAGPDLQSAWSQARATWDGTSAARRVGQLAVHGPAFVSAVRRAGGGTPAELLDAALGLHTQVERDRGRTSAWITRTPSHLLVQNTRWRSWHDDPTRWVVHYKHATLLSLLRDLGRLGATP